MIRKTLPEEPIVYTVYGLP